MGVDGSGSGAVAAADVNVGVGVTEPFSLVKTESSSISDSNKLVAESSPLSLPLLAGLWPQTVHLFEPLPAFSV